MHVAKRGLGCAGVHQGPGLMVTPPTPSEECCRSSALSTERRQPQHGPSLQRYDLCGWSRRGPRCRRLFRTPLPALSRPSRGPLGFARCQYPGELGRGMFRIPSSHLACRMMRRV